MARRSWRLLGVYGFGNIGQSAAVFLGPLLEAAVSGLLLLACFGLYRFIAGVDRETRRRP